MAQRNMDADTLLQYSPLIAISISAMTLLFTGIKFFVKRFCDSITQAVDRELKAIFGDYTKIILDENKKDLIARIQNVVKSMEDEHQLRDRYQEDVTKLKETVRILEKLAFPSRYPNKIDLKDSEYNIS